VPVVVLFVALAAVGCGEDNEAGPATSATAPLSSTSAPSTTDEPSVSTTAPATTTAPSTTVLSSLDAVTSLVAAAGGGSGEVTVSWEGVVGAAGYRVYRATEPDGPFEVGAVVDVATGEAELSEGVVDVWLPEGDFPPFTTVPGVEHEPRYQYIEVLGAGTSKQYYVVVAFDFQGEGPRSTVVCAAPSGQPAC
jgi:hypothetical protein